MTPTDAIGMSLFIIGGLSFFWYFLWILEGEYRFDRMILGAICIGFWYVGRRIQERDK